MKIQNYTPDPDDPLMESIRRRAAEDFLNHGFKPEWDGFDLSDPKVRAELLPPPLGNRPLKDFTDFQVNPVPAKLVAMLAELDGAPDYGAAHEAICQAADALYALPPALYSTVSDKNELWICRNPTPAKNAPTPHP